MFGALVGKAGKLVSGMHSAHCACCKRLGIWVVQNKSNRLYLDVLKSSVLEKIAEVTALGQAANCPHRVTGLFPDMGVECCCLRAEHWIDIQPSLHAERNAALGFHDASKFTQRGWSVGKELQCLLAKGEIEMIVVERQLGGICLHPIGIKSGARGE